MSTKLPKKTAYASLTFELGAVTTEAHLLPVGPFRAEDGRPEDAAAWQLDSKIAAKVIALVGKRKTDMLIDYEHQALRCEDNGQKVIAAGWGVGNKLEWRDGKGLYLTNIAWTEDAAEEIAKKQYRYISAVFLYEPVTGVVLDIWNVTLTNTPGLDGLDPLAALNRQLLNYPNEQNPKPLTGEPPMSGQTPEAQLAALTVKFETANSSLAALKAEHTTLKASHAALTIKHDDLQKENTALKAEKAAASEAAEKAEHEGLLTAALKDGRIAPAQKAWAEKQPLAALKEYLESSNPLLPNKRQADLDNGGDQAHGLTETELAYCTKLGVKPEEYVKTKVAMG